jgi:hypothetical protein
MTIGFKNVYPTPDILSIGIWIKAPAALQPSRVGEGREKSVGLLFTPLRHCLKAEFLCGKDESFCHNRRRQVVQEAPLTEADAGELHQIREAEWSQ